MRLERHAHDNSIPTRMHRAPYGYTWHGMAKLPINGSSRDPGMRRIAGIEPIAHQDVMARCDTRGMQAYQLHRLKVIYIATATALTLGAIALIWR